MQSNKKASWSPGQNVCSWEYDVFISFRGEDTRKNFTDHLHKSLSGKGIRAFRDSDSLEKGTDIQEDLLKAIENSWFSIIVFSKEYASSRWCLDELAKIMECPSTTAVPVFYGVEASAVRDQTGSFRASFEQHNENPNTCHKVAKWRNAMKKAANSGGWNVGDRHETEVIAEIIDYLLVRLNATIPSIIDSWNLVGMSSQVEEVIKYLNSEHLCYLGICGMSGIGKTTLAQVVYEKIRHSFDGSAFLSDIKDASEKDGIVSQQSKLLSELLKGELISLENKHKGINILQRRFRGKKVLIILDDVSNLEQIGALAEKPEWFGPGSKVIITTRDKHLLNAHGVDETYVVDALNDKDAIELFSRITFKSANPPQKYVEHCKKFVRYARGHPLALKVIGSSLKGQDRHDIRLWDSRLSVLEVNLDKEITTKLRISFNELNRTEKEVFLHIACFFNGWEKDQVEYMLGCFGEYDPTYSITTLKEKYLVNVSNGRFYVHDLIQRMGQDIVHDECPAEPGGRSRLWCLDSLAHVFCNDTATEAIHGIVLNFLPKKLRNWEAKSFKKMKKLKFLIFSGNPFSNELDYLCNELRYIDWRDFPCKTLPATFEPRRLVELNMRWSGIEGLWTGVKELPCLKKIDLSFSKGLISIPNLSKAPNLEKLILICCERLSKIDDSLGSLKELALLNLRHCKALKTLPDSLSKLEKSLQILDISGCRNLNSLPRGLHTKSLKKLLVNGSGVSKEYKQKDESCFPKLFGFGWLQGERDCEMNFDADEREAMLVQRQWHR